MKRLLLLPLLLTLAKAEVVLEPLVVTGANNSQQLVANLPENVSIITAEDLEKSHATTLTEALNRLAGIAFSSNGGLGTSTSFYLRGFDSKRTLVLIDGIRYNDPTGLNGAEIQHITLDEIERIEIIKGAQSGIWGADASAGVINIITKASKKGYHMSAKTEHGTYGLQKYIATASYKNDLINIKLSASQLETTGISAAESKLGDLNFGTRGLDAGFEADGYKNNSNSLKLGYQISSKHYLELSANTISTYTEYDDGSADDNDTKFSTINNIFYQALYTFENENSELKIAYKASHFDRNFDNLSPYTGAVSEWIVTERINGDKEDFILLGASSQEFSQDKSGSTDLNANYQTNSIFGSNYNKIDNTIVSESIRIDSYNSFDNTVTGKLGIKQSINDNLALKLNLASGYNVPTLNQLFASYGNPLLSPESTLSSDITFEISKFKLTYFYNEITDMIAWEGVGYTNILGQSILQGTEITYSADLIKTINLGLNYTYLNAKDADGFTLARRPEHQADLRLTYAPRKEFSLLTHIQYIGTRYELADNQGAQTGEYTLINLVANYNINKKLKAYIKVDNLFDTFYQVVDGYGTAGLSGYIGLSASY